MKALLLFILSTLPVCAADPIEIKLWPDGAPGQMLPHSKGTEDFIRTKSGKNTLTDIHDPTITVYRPEKPNGTSVIVAPGGGYVFLSAVHEGTQVCEWLNSIGVTGVLLKYRTPTRDEAAPHEKPVADAARAIALVREHAKDWSLDPKRVGLLGFSAGGNLLAHISCDRATKTELPNFGIMIYGGGFVDFKDPTKLKDGFTVPKDAPPMFLACAHDDGQNPTAATVLYLEYKKLGIPCEIHLFTKGGHGFGMRDNKQPINAWPQRCAEWMGAMGWLPTPTTGKKMSDETFLFCFVVSPDPLEPLSDEEKAIMKFGEPQRRAKFHDAMNLALAEPITSQAAIFETLKAANSRSQQTRPIELFAPSEKQPGSR